MPVREDAWPAGTPGWIDLAADDPQRAAAFYATLLGWTVADPDTESGGYLIATLGDRAVAGIGGKPTPDMPSNWATYLSSDDADATAAAVRAAGGSLHMDPFDVMDAGRMFFGTSPDGSTFGVWQSGAHTGVGMFNEPGALAWNELLSRDLDAARDFYGSVFGLTYDEIGTADFRYLLFSPPAAQRPAGGMGTAETLPEGVPSMWLTWFAVTSCDEAVATVAELGGSTLMEPRDSPFGRRAVVTGAEGEVFGVIALDGSETAR